MCQGEASRSSLLHWSCFHAFLFSEGLIPLGPRAGMMTPAINTNSPDLPLEISFSLPPQKMIHPTHLKTPILTWVKLLSGREGFIGPDMSVFGAGGCLSVSFP